MAFQVEAKRWPLQDAKARFSELVNRCADEGAQTVTRHGKPVAVLLDWEEYRGLRNRSQGLAAFFAAAPRVELELERPLESERELTL